MLRATTTPAADKFQIWMTQTWLTLGAAVLAAGFLQAGAHAAARANFTSAHGTKPLALALEPVAPPANGEKVLAWQGKDVDGDGAADFVNPTGQAPRTHDAY